MATQLRATHDDDEKVWMMPHKKTNTSWTSLFICIGLYCNVTLKLYLSTDQKQEIN